MRAVTFQAPGEVRVEDRPDPEVRAPGDAVVAVEATGICGSDLHIYHGRVVIEPGFVIGHEFVGRVSAAGAEAGVAVGDRVVGCFLTACGRCRLCRLGLHQKCQQGGVFGHGRALGDLAGAQAGAIRVPNAALCLRRLPPGVSDAAALFAGDVAATAHHALVGAVRPGDSVAVLGLGPVGLCAVQAARAMGAAEVLGIDSVAQRLAMAERFGAIPVHLERDDARAVARRVSGGLGVDVAVEAVGRAEAFDAALRLLRDGGLLSVVGVHAEPATVHLGLLWFKGITVRAGQANVITAVDAVLAEIAAGVLDPTPLVDREMALEDAVEAYRIYDRRESLKLLLRP